MTIFNIKKSLTILFKYFLLLLCLKLSIDISFCEDISEESLSDNDNNNWNLKKILLYTAAGVLTAVLIYYVFFYDPGSGAVEIDDDSAPTPMYPVPRNRVKRVICENPVCTMHDYYMIFDFNDSVNIHLSDISNQIVNFTDVYYKEIPMVHMSDYDLNCINWKHTVGNLDYILKLPKDSEIAFSHFSLSETNEIFYQVLTAGEFQKLIEIYGIQ
jgi:hypothetical protein